MKTSHNESRRLLSLFFLTALLCAPLVAYPATRTWDGGDVHRLWTSPTNWVDDLAPVAGDDLVFPLGFSTSNENDFPAGTTFNSITFLGGNYTLNGSNLALNAGIRVSASVGNNTIFLPLTLNSNQSFTVSNANFGSALNLRGPIGLGQNTLTLAGPGFFQVQSRITGEGGLRKLGAGGALLYATNTFAGPTEVVEGSLSIYRALALGATNSAAFVETNAQLTLAAGVVGPFVVERPLTLAGMLGGVSTAYHWTGPITLAGSNATVNVNSPSAPLFLDGLVSGGGLDKTGAGTLTLAGNNTYTNRTRVVGGVLLVNGVQPQSAVMLVEGILGGTGVVGTVTASGAFAKTLAPGGSAGILTCSNVTLSSLTTFRIELNGVNSGSGFDQLNVTGGVTLSNAVLNATLGFPSAISNVFTIIQNDGADAVTNTFVGLSEGATVSVSGTPFRISYVGGSGNDVSLTQLAATQQPLLNLQRALQTNVVLSWATNFTGYTLEANTNLNTNVWAVVSPPPAVSGTNNVVTNNTSGVQRLYRLRAP